MCRAARQVLVSVNPYRFVHVQLALQEEKLRLEEEALYAAQREAARAARQRKLLEVRGRPQRTPGLPLLVLSDFPARINSSLVSRGCTYTYMLRNLKGR